MAKLDLSAAWNETVAIAKREAQLMFLIAFLLIALPGAILQALLPTPDSGGDPNLLLLLLIIPVAVVSAIGSLALSRLALAPPVTGKDALALGARRLLTLLGAVLLIALGALLVMIPLILMLRAATPAGGGGPGAGVVLFMLVFIIASIALWVRLMLITPVVVAEPVGPLGALKRSWSLTGGHFWKLLGLLILLVVVAVVIMVAVSTVGGLLIVVAAGRPDPGSVSAFLTLLLASLINAVFTVYFTALVARLYAQMSGHAQMPGDAAAPGFSGQSSGT